MNTNFPTAYHPLGETTLLIEWPKEISTEILDELLLVQKSLEQNPIPGVLEWNAAYQSLAIHYDPEQTSFEELRNQLINSKIDQGALRGKKQWTIPVCYHPTLGSDLEAFCQAKKLSMEQVIRLHTTPMYTVYFLGFLPGFMYLGGLDEKLHQARKQNPDRSIMTGSVAIGGSQTGIYPTESPGGWHVIGNCPLKLFDADQDPPCFVKPGDVLRFEPVDLNTYEQIGTEVASEKYHPKHKIIHG